MGNMTNTQFYLLLGATLASVSTTLVGVIWSRVDHHQLTGRIDRISADLSTFNHELGRHDEAIEMLKEKRP